MLSFTSVTCNRSASFCIVIFFVSSVILGQSCTAQSVQNYDYPVMPPQVPEYVVFAGDTVRFDRSDLRERMDRELIAFTYSHSVSVLMIKRANKFFPQIEPILRSNGIPDDLKYLMVIESNLDPRSLSSAGAAGLWQFTESTGKAYGLEVNKYIDERYNTEKSTIAACRFLSEAYGKYGNWMTVAASYNGGQQGMSRKIVSQRQTNAMDMWLAEETSRYMFRLLAVKMLFADPSSFGFQLHPEDLYPCILPKDTVVVTHQIDNLVQFAEDHSVSYAQLKMANLWLRDSILMNKSNRTYVILIPDVAAEHYDPAKTIPYNSAWVVK